MVSFSLLSRGSRKREGAKGKVRPPKITLLFLLFFKDNFFPKPNQQPQVKMPVLLANHTCLDPRYLLTPAISPCAGHIWKGIWFQSLKNTGLHNTMHFSGLPHWLDHLLSDKREVLCWTKNPVHAFHIDLSIKIRNITLWPDHTHTCLSLMYLPNHE